MGMSLELGAKEIFEVITDTNGVQRLKKLMDGTIQQIIDSYSE